MHVSSFHYHSPNGSHIQAGFVTFERQLSYESVASFLYDEYLHVLQNMDLIVLRPAADKPVKKLPKKKVALIIQRFPNLSLHVLSSYNYTIQFSRNLNPKTTSPIAKADHLHFTDFLRENQLQEFITRSAALFKSPEHHIYRMPSQEYSHCFLRVGNIQTGRHVLDSIFFWALPFLKDCGSILTDSWSISSIALNMGRLICRYDKTIKLSSFHINMLTSHFDGSKTIDRNTERDLEALTQGNDKDILLLISAVKTRKSLDNITWALSSTNFRKKISPLAIYKIFESGQVNALSMLGEDFCKSNQVTFDSFDEPPEGQQVIEIDSKVFFPVSISESEIEIRRPCTRESEDFFRAYEGRNVISLHRDSFYNNQHNSVDRFRHHGIYINVSQMLLQERFINKLEGEINALPLCPSLIIYPPHEHGRDLVTVMTSLLEKKFGKNVPVFAVLDLNFPQLLADDPLIVLLKEQTEHSFILVVDDVSTTGSRLRGYQKHLREIYKGQIGYFIGVARPDHTAKLDKIINYLTYRPSENNSLPKHTVTYLEKIILPDWDDKTCPWCVEKNVINKASGNYAGQAVSRRLKERVFELENALKNGLENDVFISITNDAKPIFAGGSIFSMVTGISEADLVACVATAIQSLRNNGGKIAGTDHVSSLNGSYPHFKIIDIKSYIGPDEAFNDALIKAILFRCCNKWELHAIRDGNLRRQKEGIAKFLAGENINNNQRGFFLYELYLALKERKLPKPTSDKKLFSILEETFVP